MSNQNIACKTAVACFLGVLAFLCPSYVHAANEADSFEPPLDGDRITNQEFGVFSIKSQPDGKITRCGFHLGEDLDANPGTEIKAIANGVVKRAQHIPSLGYAIIVEHMLSDGRKVTSNYFHTKLPGEEGGITLKTDQMVSKGETIAYVTDNTNETGSGFHLHFGVRNKPYSGLTDSRTLSWFYPGYSTIFENLDDGERGDPLCDHDDPTHDEILSEWCEPFKFIETQQCTDGSPPSGQVTRIVNATGLPENIPDPALITRVLNFPVQGAIVAMELFFEFPTQCERNHYASIRDPEGRTVNVMNRGLGRCSGVLTTFNSTNTQIGDSGFFGGRQAGGNWTFSMYDLDADGHNGILNDVRLTITVEQ